jgi:hypothetical protein
MKTKIHKNKRLKNIHQNLMGMNISAFILQPVNLLQQIAKSVDKELLLVGLEEEAAVRRSLDDAEGRVALTRGVAFHRNTLEIS